MLHRLFFFPDYQLTNPYQSLLYAHLHEAFFAEAGAIDRAVQHLEDRPAGRTLFHLHWQDAVYATADDAVSAERAAQHFLLQVQRFVEAGGLFVWTLHNNRPHRQRFPELDQELRRAVAEIAHLVHVHSLAAVEIATALGVEPRRLAVVPHGNYLPVLAPALATRAERRGVLGLEPSERLIVHFGRLLPYKGTRTLLEALSALTNGPAWRLILAGAFALDLDLEAAAPVVASRTIRKGGHMDHKELVDLIDAADLVVLPYDEILTSGAMMLALSLGKPLVLPALDVLLEVVAAGREAWFYPPESGAAGLAEVLRLALTSDAFTLEQMGRAATRTASRHDWRILGGQFSDALLRVVMDAGRKPRPLPTLDPL